MDILIDSREKDRKMVNFGSYKDKRVAELVRDLLMTVDWDKEYLPSIREYAVFVIGCVDNCWRCQGYGS